MFLFSLHNRKGHGYRNSGNLATIDTVWKTPPPASCKLIFKFPKISESAIALAENSLFILQLESDLQETHRTK